jgi:hypothetical protein
MLQSPTIELSFEKASAEIVGDAFKSNTSVNRQ